MLGSAAPASVVTNHKTRLTIAVRRRRGQAPGANGAGQRAGGFRPQPTAAELAHRAEVVAPLARMRPVTNEMLLNPPPGDWLMLRRTYDAHSFSPLTQINRSNVKNLRVAWAWGLNSTDGAVTEFTPLVHDGVMFMWNYGETIQALDAKTGTLLWQFS